MVGLCVVFDDAARRRIRCAKAGRDVMRALRGERVPQSVRPPVWAQREPIGGALVALSLAGTRRP
jgi:hypothetical protein